jgi:hypothetical protein
MRKRLGRRTGRTAVVLAVVAGLLSQGCILEKKMITDVYTAVSDVDENETRLVNTLSFGTSYCIPPGELDLQVKLKFAQAALLTGLLIQATLVESAGSTTWDFLLAGKNGKFKGAFATSSLCVDPGDELQWFVTPFGIGIPLGAVMSSKLKYQADEL